MIQDKDKINLINWNIVSINPKEKNWNWIDLFCVWANSTQSIIGFSLIASLYILYDISFLLVLCSSLFAAFLVCFFANLISKPSQKYGLPFPVILRISTGIIGAKYISLFRGIVGIFMFGVQTYFISKSIGYLIRIFIYKIEPSLLEQELFLYFFMGLNSIDLFSLVLTLIIQYTFFSAGAKINRTFIKFSAFFVYFGLIFFSFLIISENFSALKETLKEIIVVENIFIKENINPFLTITGTMFAYLSIMILSFGDFSRYVKNNSEIIKGNLSLLINLLLFSFFAIIIVLGSQIIFSNNNIQIERILTNPADIIGKFDNAYITVVVLFFILFASLSTNLIANYIPSQNVLLNFLPSKLNLKGSGLIIIFFALLVGIFWEAILSKIGILSIVDTFASFFGPIFGIMVVDYYITKKGTIINKLVFSSGTESSYYYSSGWHIKAIYSILIGFIFAASTIWNTNLMFLQSYSWIIGAFVAAFVYYLLAIE